MARATFEHEGNTGLLTVTTHFGRTSKIPCDKQGDEHFRLGGTAINEVVVYEGLVLNYDTSAFRAFRTPENPFEDIGVLSDEDWSEADRHCYVTEHYVLDMEGKKHSWFISKNPIKDANQLFVNLDVLDGGGNVVKRYRVSPFTGEHIVMESING